MNLRTLCLLCHMRAFRYRKYCAKGFFWEIIIVEGKGPTKMAKKSRKCIFLLNEKELEKVIEFRPQLFFNFKGGNTSSTFFQFLLLTEICDFGPKIYLPKYWFLRKILLLQQFLYQKAFIWPPTCPLLKFINHP